MRITVLVTIIAAILSLALGANAQSATGMAAMQYYVGTWSCTGGAPNKTPGHATITYTLDDGILRQMVNVPAQGKMGSSSQSDSTIYDTKNGRYVDAGISNNGRWWIGYTTLTGNTEHSVDHLTSSGKLGHGVTVRASSTTFTFMGYPTLTGGKPDFKGTCHKS